jgi:putative membrane protein
VTEGEPERRGEDGAVDATRRTRLANERTFLAWWRTGLTAFALAIAIGRLLPELTTGARWPFVVLGAAFGVLGVFMIAHAHRRHHEVDRALDEGGYAPLAGASMRVLGAAGIALGIATVVLVLFELR